MEGDTLTIRARRTLRSEDAQWLTQERPAGAYMRLLTLGQGVDAEGIHAHYENGVLSLTIPVGQQARSRKIEVETGRDQQQIGQGDMPAQGEGTRESSEWIGPAAKT